MQCLQCLHSLYGYLVSAGIIGYDMGLCAVSAISAVYAMSIWIYLLCMYEMVRYVLSATAAVSAAPVCVC